MLYWRKDSFEQLAQLKDKITKIPELSDYAKYLELLDRGLRKEALKHIEDLLSTLRALPKERQRFLAVFLMSEVEASRNLGHELTPHPLYERFIKPVIHSWTLEEPTNPEPFRWTLSLQDLIRAVQLDPSSDRTRARLIKRILGFIRQSTHELPAGYVGNVESDYDLLKLALREAALLNDAEAREKYSKALEAEKNEIDAYRSKKD